jgi:hypothetical protein
LYNFNLTKLNTVILAQYIIQAEVCNNYCQFAAGSAHAFVGATIGLEELYWRVPEKYGEPHFHKGPYNIVLIHKST